jgi:alpha-N-arabinofuranosidase
MNEGHHAEIFITLRPEGMKLGLRNRIGGLQAVVGEIPAGAGPWEIKVEAQPEKYLFWACLPTGWKCLGEAETKYFSSEVAGGFTGVYLGMYATGNGRFSTAPADFDWFKYQPADG